MQTERIKKEFPHFFSVQLGTVPFCTFFAGISGFSKVFQKCAKRNRPQLHILRELLRRFEFRKKGFKFLDVGVCEVCVADKGVEQRFG